MDDARTAQDQGQAELHDLPVDRIEDHPDNPRIALRADVVEKIASELRLYGYQVEYAPIVRPLGDGWQIVEGHHRIAAAREVGIGDVPCWVKPMGDDEAFMRLVLGNTQGELSPLEIGLHALDAVSPARGGRGVVGGIAEYAARIGRDRSRVSQLIDAGKVAKTRESSNGFSADHLYQISRAPREAWPPVIDWLLKRTEQAEKVDERAPTVSDVKRQSLNLRRLDELLTDRHRRWIDYEEACRAVLGAERHSVDRFTEIVNAVDQVDQWIANHGSDEQAERFDAWLQEARWDARPIIQHLQELLASQYEVEGWHHGDWREHLEELEDRSVGLLLTDPPYGVAYQSNYRQQKHAAITGDATADEAMKGLNELLEQVHTKLGDDAHLLIFAAPEYEQRVADTLTDMGYDVRSRIVWDKQRTGMGDLKGAFAPQHERIVHAVKGAPVLYNRQPDVLSTARANSSNHPTEKPTELLRTLIEATTAKGQLVADPYGGVASTCVAAKESGRQWWGCEIDETYFEVGEKRLR